ncbi:hypothetical protein KY316_02260 [Candidatus Woesearchaeota archaeon]|nr:hypothetical protein [Candidatus Woesearchaeota archaeon]
MVLGWLIGMGFFVLAAWISYKIFKKAMKALVAVAILAAVALVVSGFLVVNDAKDFYYDVDEDGMVYLYEDKVGAYSIDDEEFAVAQEDLSKPYKDILGTRARIAVYSKAALEQSGVETIKIDDKDYTMEQVIGMLNAPEYGTRLKAFDRVVKATAKTNPKFILVEYKKGNIIIYPSSPVTVFVDNVPMFIVDFFIKR